jgi:hypothetical protein
MGGGSQPRRKSAPKVGNRNILASFWTTENGVKRIDDISKSLGISRAHTIRLMVAFALQKSGNEASFNEIFGGAS